MAKQSNLIYALKEGVIISIADAESGKKCGCTCPACGEELIAKKGTKRMHHFAHAPGTSCEYGCESSLHLAAKDILSKAKRITIPAVYVHFPDSYKKDELVCESKEIEIERVELEKRYSGIIPDVVVTSGGKQFFIEIFVTHPVDEIKLSKLQDANISTIEIDLSKKESTFSAADLEDLLLKDSPEKKWKFNGLAKKYLNRFIQSADERMITSRGYAMHVDNCPIRMREWRGKAYANFIDDCLYCKYCIAHGETLLCSGRTRISSISDFSISENQRVTESNKKIEEEKTTAFVEGKCPNCGCSLVVRQSKYGSFWGCSNYPHCRFTVSSDPKTGEIIMKA